MLRIVVSGPQDDVDVLARALRDAGHEVVHAGTRVCAEQLVATALQEDADAVVLAGEEPGSAAVGRLVDLLVEHHADDVRVLTGSPTEVVDAL